jgi:hypothetical protein
LIVDQDQAMASVGSIETKLKANPQYAYARKLGQLQPLALLQALKPWTVYERHQAEQGIRLGDIKPVALRSERYWINLFKGQT